MNTKVQSASSHRLSFLTQIPRKLYDWVLSWAQTKWGSVALFAIAFAESSFFPVPPDVLLVALVLGSRARWFKFAFLCTAGSVIGGLAGYAIGMFLMESVGQPIVALYHAEAYYDKVMAWYQTYDYWIVFVAAFTPIPYKVFTIASGVFNMNILGFILVSFCGRGLRFFLVSGLLYLFGEPVKAFIDKYFDLLCIAFIVLLIGGFAIIGIM